MGDAAGRSVRDPGHGGHVRRRAARRRAARHLARRRVRGAVRGPHLPPALAQQDRLRQGCAGG